MCSRHLGIAVATLLCVVAAEVHAQRWTIDSTKMRRDTLNLPVVEVMDVVDEERFVITHAPDVQIGTINVGKKTEVIRMASVIGNTATNNPRQALMGIAGLNIFDNDVTGVNMSIGGRGLNPNRNVHLVTRQNGYDISADPYGYPEAYYTPPLEAVSRIDMVRGAGALRYGSQFGGTINFVMADGSRDRAIGGDVSLTGGGYGFAGLFARIGGTVENTNYVAFVNARHSDGWRPNSQLNQLTGYAAVTQRLSESVKLRADYTHMYFEGKQPGGLTDDQFTRDPSVSLRNRNWFRLDWNLASVTADWMIDEATTVRSQFFGTYSTRSSVGVVTSITTPDTGGVRTVNIDTYRNVGNETTLQHDGNVLGTALSFMTGIRLYTGETQRRQGNGTAGADANYAFTSPQRLEGSDFTFPTMNAAWFTELVLRPVERLSITPGVRVERIATSSEGYYRFRQQAIDTTISSREERARTVMLGGLGLAYDFDNVRLTFNATQNYRAIWFSDLRVTIPNYAVDANIKDESGYTLEAGVRGRITSILSWDVTGFMIRYNGKTGEIVQNINGTSVRVRTNVADAYSRGIEALADLSVTRLFTESVDAVDVHVIFNGTMLDSRYDTPSDTSINGKHVEYAPSAIIRTGLQATYKGLRGSFLVSHTTEQFTDAKNTLSSANATAGKIPAYTVADLTLGYTYDRYSLDVSCNNLFGNSFFTRRTGSYPGPGIIPAEPRNVFATLRVTF